MTGILFVGDTAFGENYQDRLGENGKENVLRVRGYDHMIGAFGEMFAAASYVVANLETPVTDLPTSPLEGKKKYLHYADPEKTPRMLNKYGFNMVSLANNHAVDFGLPGLFQTIDILTGHGITAIGAGRDARDASAPGLIEPDSGSGRRPVAIFASFIWRKRYAEKYGFYAGDGIGGVSALSAPDIAGRIAALRADKPDCHVVAFPHWGKDYTPVTDDQREAGKALIDAGADLVIGHGAHIAQAIERHAGRWIVYGLGNFVFGSPGRFAAFDAPPYGMIADLRLAATAAEQSTLRFYPVVTDNRLTGYQPRFVSAHEFTELVDYIAAQSDFPGDPRSVTQTGEDRFGHYLELSDRKSVV